MYRFLLKPKWIGFHLLCIFGIVLMVDLGIWQLHRLQSRKDFNAEVRARTAEPVVPVEEVVTDGVDPDDVQWRTVTATGTYLPDEQVVVVNRSQGGFSGVNVVTPLELADGTIVLINRGFVPDATPVPVAPTGEVEVLGRLRESQQRSIGQLTEVDGELTEVFRIDIPRLADQLPAEVMPLYVDLLDSTPSQGDLPDPLPDPDLSEGPHLSYMIQWWIFSTCVAVGWVLAVRRSVRQHRLDVQAPQVSAADGSTPADPSSSADDEAATAPG